MKSVWFALAAVAMWSIAAAVVGLMGVDTASLTLAFWASTIGALTVGALAVVAGGVRPSAAAALGWSDWGVIAAAGLSICVYELMFIYAIKNTPRVEAYMINYLWPIFSIGFFWIYLDSNKRRRLNSQDWGFIGLAFMGSALMLVPELRLNQFSSYRLGYWAAMGAAVTGGLNDLLGTLVKRRLRPLVVTSFGSRPDSDTDERTAFLAALTCSAGISALLLGAAAVMSGVPLALGTGDLVAAAVYGAFVITLGRVAWLYALEQAASYNVASLAYVTPVIGVILLNVVLGDRVTPTVVLGISTIVASNYLLHARQAYTSATTGTYAAFVITGFMIYASRHTSVERDTLFGNLKPLVATGDVGSDVIALVGGLFAILAGFTLSRVSSVNRDQEVLHLQIDGALAATWDAVRNDSSHAPAIRPAIDKAMRAVVDFDFAVTQGRPESAMETLFRRVDEAFDTIRSVLAPATAGTETLTSTRDLVRRWAYLRAGRLPAGELFALWALGILNVVFYFHVRPDSLLGDLSCLAFTGAVVFLLLTIRDYDRDRPSRRMSGILLRQRTFAEIGEPYYFPADMLDGSYVALPDRNIEVRVAPRTGGTLDRRTIYPEDRLEKVVRLFVMAGSIAAVAVLLLSGRWNQ